MKELGLFEASVVIVSITIFLIQLIFVGAFFYLIEKEIIKKTDEWDEHFFIGAFLIIVNVLVYRVDISGNPQLWVEHLSHSNRLIHQYLALDILNIGVMFHLIKRHTKWKI